ncbi:hybrid sensor histidine kinase/response regulator transcription factor [Flavicella sediminum]|uniref:hybrid sensor histidine kinase/response regulator transcription factor n=1 Tax=Flavicella sediminum TaxID=2585141 RepID=UPI001FB7EFD8|nr:two-component regulator propeller domain-containing protein [Flavicella sediminum]
MSNNSIIAIEQDSKGHMWFGTRNGLNKFNGNEFVAYRNDPKDVTSISNSDILDVLEDRDGNIWVGTYNGLNRFDPKKNAFERYYQNTKDKNSIVNGVVICSKEMQNGELWFGTANGISIYNKKRNNFTNTFYGDVKKEAFAYKNIQSIFLDQNKQIWVGTTKGLAKLESRSKGKFVFKEFNRNEEEAKLFIQDIIEVSPGVLGIATKYNGFFLFHIETQKFSRTSYTEIHNDIDVRVLQKDDEGNLWLGTTGGVFVITSAKKVIHLKENNVENSGISQNFIKSIFKDQSGSIWLGTYTGGANIWSKTNENFIHIKDNKVFNNVVNSIVYDDKSNVYFGTEGGVISTLDKDGKISHVLKVPYPNSKVAYAVQTMLYTKPNLLWVGVLNHGVFVYDLKTKKQRKDIISKELKKYLKNTGVFAIKEGSHGDFWIGTFGKGIVKYNVTTKKITKIRRPTIRTNIIKTIFLDDDGKIWTGGLGSVNVLSLNEVGSYDVARYLVGGRFLSYNVKTIFKDKNKNIWVGTNSRGLYKFNGNDFEKVVVAAENPISTVNTILEDDQHFLWLSTDKGIVKFDARTKESIVYKQKSIESKNDFSPNSGLKLKNNQFYFGGLQGITTFNSDKIIKNEYAPKVLLSDLKLKNETVKVGDDNEILSKSIIYTTKIKLAYDNANFSISYSLPSYVNPSGNSYAYRLRGLDDTWTYTEQKEAFFTLQTSGSYVFEVKGANNDGVWNENSTSLEIIVTPAPWKTWWAYTTYFICICGAFYAIYWILQSKARLQHKLALEYVESKRNKELNNAKLQFFTNISHEFRTPLTLILGPLQQILNNYTGTNAIYKRLKIIEGSADHLLRLINRLMDFRKLESDQFELEAAEGNIVKFLREIFLSFSEYAKLGAYEYTFSTSQNKISMYYDRYKLERVFYNLISNAFRYTEKGGSIAISITTEDGELVVKIKDSGVGIADEFLEKIFDRFFEVPIHNKAKENYNKGTGIGLSIASNIVKLHHGTISVENVKPHGAEFTVRLKLGKEHLSEVEIMKNFKMSDDVSQYVSQINAPKIEITNDVEDLLKEEKKYTLLIVEDNPVLRSFIKETLKPDYNIVQAENGRVALQLAKKHLPDLIISDVIMPEMVGTELCSKIKTNIKTSHIPVILLTSRTSLVYKFEGLESGADDYISKPFNIKEFKLKIKNLLESKERIKEKFSSEDHYAAFDVSLTSLDEELLKKAYKVVEANLSNEDFGIDLFCEEIGVSRSMLFTKIKAWTNHTPKDFIQEIRLKRAAKLLELDKLSVAEVGYRVGFKRPKYFSQCFRKKYGLSPTEYADKFSNPN